ncbi:fructose-6-phosphate aldolase [Candidatus Micrarchaeota archaeon]|nr:fructose-6-phosphate aldolase [Candidatus Micrarchaeota archaeon]
MKLFIDTADLKEIQEAAQWGVIDGVTTNPSLVAKTGNKDFKQVVQEITKLIDGPISAETISSDAKGMVEEGQKYAKWHKNIVIKVPMTEDGIQACKKLADEGIRVNVTLVFSANQALLAAKAGAYFVSPFVGRIDDAGADGMQLVRDIVQIYKNYGFKTQVLAASIRHPVHVLDTAKAGADVATCPYKVLKQLFRHPLTDKGVRQFLDDWKKLQSG